MFKWLTEFFRKQELWEHIRKEQCFVFPILPKNKLEDGVNYVTFDFSHKYYVKKEWWHTEYSTKTAQWCAEKNCFIDGNHFKLTTLSYEEFKPLRKLGTSKEEINYGICSYNPCDVNQLDLEELRKITFDLNDDNTESEEVWERLITYFEERGISQ